MDIKTLREEFNTLKSKNDELLKKAMDEKRDLTDAEKADSDKDFARMSVIKDLDERNAKFAEHAFKSNSVTVISPQDAPGKEEMEFSEAPTPIKVGRSLESLKTAEGKARLFAAVNEWAKTGNDTRKKFAVTGNTITSTTANGILFPKDVLDLVTPTAPNTLRQALAAVGMSAMSTPTTREMTLPVVLPTAGSVVAENATVETEQEPTVGPGIDLVPVCYQAGNTWISNKEVNAVDFDIVAEMIPTLMYGKELAFESAALTQVSNDTNITQTVPAASDTGITYANFVALNRILPKYYNFKKVIILSKAAYIAAENLVTTTGYPILNADAQGEEFKSFNGTPVLWSDYLSGFGTSGKVIGLVISFAGFKVRDAGDQEVTRYQNYPERPAQTGFNVFGFHCIGYDVNAVAKLVLP